MSDNQWVAMLYFKNGMRMNDLFLHQDPSKYLHELVDVLGWTRLDDWSAVSPNGRLVVRVMELRKEEDQ